MSIGACGPTVRIIGDLESGKPERRWNPVIAGCLTSAGTV
jgi:hypothetical protein